VIKMATKGRPFANKENGQAVNAKINRMPTRSQSQSALTSRPALGDLGNKKIGVRRPGVSTDQDKKPVTKKQQTSKTTSADEAVKIETDGGIDDQPMDVDHMVEAVSTTDPIRPESVPDIDQLDALNPQLCAEYVPSMYAYLREIERKTPIKPNFLNGCPINGKMRGVLLDWLIEVHLQFKLLQETLYMTTFIIDRFLQVEGLTIRRKKLQLVGVTSMLIASKVEEMYAPEVNDFVYITDNAYSANEIKEMEIRILNSIRFGLGRPLPLHFLRRNSKAGNVDVLQHTVAKYLLESSLLEYDMAHYSPSIQAAAALFLALRLLEPDATLESCWTPTLQHYSTYTKEKLLPVVSKMAAVMKKAKDSKLQAVHTKYLSKKFLKVADMSELKGEIIQQLAVKNYENL